MKVSKCLSYPLFLLWTKMINPFLNSRISVNHDKVEGFQSIKKGIVSLLLNFFCKNKTCFLFLISSVLVVAKCSFYTYGMRQFLFYRYADKWNGGEGGVCAAATVLFLRNNAKVSSLQPIFYDCISHMLLINSYFYTVSPNFTLSYKTLNA